MLKKRVLKRLLPLLFSFCFVFSGFLSVNAFAYSGNDYNFFPFVFSDGSDGFLPVLDIYNSGTVLYSDYADSLSADNIYNFSNSSYSTNGFIINNINGAFYFPYEPDLYDYYYIFTFSADSDFPFINYLDLPTYDSDNDVAISNLLTISRVFPFDELGRKGFTYIGELPLLISPNIVSLVTGFDFSTLGSNLHFEGLIISVSKTLSSSVDSVIAAINNQTSQLGSDIGQAADDIQQSIEDQYSGDPETEFSVDDVISQHNEKMGVLSFGSDVMLQFLDMFQSANVGTAELTLPGFNITVENVEYSVWPDYSFNFEQLNEWVPALMSAIRVMLPAFVWLMVLRYCIKVFEDNFLAK